ncbi:MAG: hypothetical protein J6B56_04165 [Clostridia bacterium]|nr:hypothetical protein [Clostridia bacterium]
MIPFYAILTNTEVSDPLQQLPMLVGAVALAVLLIAFFIGFAKGFRRVSWGGFVWVAASAGYFLLEYFLGAENPLKPFVTTFIADEATANFLSSFAFVLACILVALLLQGVCSLLFRPRVKLVNRDGDRFTVDENGIEYDDEDKDYDDYEDYRPRKMLVRKGCRRPNLFGRLIGGLICAINAAAVLVVIVSFALFVVCATPLKEGALAPMFSNEYMPLVQEYAFKYAFDFLMIGVILKIARKGYEKGFMESLRSLIVGVGRLVGICVAFYLPFSQFVLPVEEGGVEILHSFVYRCVDAATMMGLPETFAPIVGQILAGLLLFVLVLLVFALLNFILKKLAEGIEGVGFFRTIDSTLACLVYLLVGVAVCLLVWVAFYVVGSYGIFDVNTLLAEGSLAKKLLDTCAVYIQPALDNFNAILAGLVAPAPAP